MKSGTKVISLTQKAAKMAKRGKKKQKAFLAKTLVTMSKDIIGLDKKNTKQQKNEVHAIHIYIYTFEIAKRDIEMNRSNKHSIRLNVEKRKKCVDYLPCWRCR